MAAVLTRNTGRLVLGAALGFVLLGAVIGALIGVAIDQQQRACGVGTGPVGGSPTAAAREIPAPLLPIFRAAERRYGVPWNVLAAINKVETDFGRNLNVSSAGAIGWMQFMPATWAAYGTDGDSDGRKDPYEPEDAIASAARYLKASGAQRDLHDALFAYNHAEWYVQKVLALARGYATGILSPGPPLTLVADHEQVLTTSATGLRYPLAHRGPVIATPTEHRARPLGNWQSDNAIDIAVPARTAVLAVTDATVSRTGGTPPTRSSASPVGGLSITLRTADGREIVYSHLLRVNVSAGQRVQAGHTIGLSGYAAGAEHLHIALSHGDPMALMGADGALAGVEVAACEPAGPGPAELDQAVELRAPRAYATLPAWAMAGGRAAQQVDARILPGVEWILRTYGLRVTAAREAGHNTHGDGTALDLVPANPGSQAAWDRSALRLATDIGWTPACANSGAAPACPLKPWARLVAYNGFPAHGDPAHCSGGCHAHLHLSWFASSYGNGGLVAPNNWVRVFPAPGAERSAGPGAGSEAPVPRVLAVVGDSLAVGAAPDLRSALPDWQVVTDARTGRTLAEGMRIIETIDGTPAALAVSLFTNDDPGHAAELEAAVRRSVRGQRCVLWATIRRLPVNGVSYQAANLALRRLEPELPALHVVDWARAVDRHPDWIGPDGVHPTANGWAARAALYARAARQCAA